MDLCLPPIAKDAAECASSPLPPSSFYFSFGLHCPLPFQLSCLRFTRPCDPHTALLLQWPVVPLSARSRAKYISSCSSFTTIDKDVQVTFSTPSDPATLVPSSGPRGSTDLDSRWSSRVLGPHHWYWLGRYGVIVM